MRVACAVHTTKIEYGIKLHVIPFRVHLGLMKTNHSLRVLVISKSNENILAR